MLATSLAPLAVAQTLGGPFTLTDADGKPVRSTDFRGKWLLLYFGYTHCADFCPTELGVLAGTLDELGPAAPMVQPVFITIDPERDTGAYLRDYTRSFSDRILALGGTTAQIAEVARAYGVRYEKIPSGDGDYDFDHSSNIYAVDPEGRYAVTFGHMSDPYMIASKLLELMNGRRPEG